MRGGNEESKANGGESVHFNWTLYQRLREERPDVCKHLWLKQALGSGWMLDGV